jgi:hypothetical protein
VSILDVIYRNGNPKNRYNLKAIADATLRHIDFKEPGNAGIDVRSFRQMKYSFVDYFNGKIKRVW